MHVVNSQKDSTNHDINILETIYNLRVLYEKKNLKQLHLRGSKGYF